MALQSDAVDLDALGFDLRDDGGCGGGFVAWVFDVVVVVVELDVSADGFGGFSREFEGQWDVAGADGVEPEVGAVGAVIVEAGGS